MEYVDVSLKDGSEEEDREASSDEVGCLQGNRREDESDASNHIGAEPLTLNFGPPIGKRKNPPLLRKVLHVLQDLLSCFLPISL